MSIDSEYATAHIVEFDGATGAIIGSGVMSIRQVVDILATHANWLIGRGSIDEHYVDLPTREIRLRGPCPAALTGSTLTGVPVPARLTWQHDSGSGGVVEVTNSTVDLDFGLPGVYRVTVEAVPCLPKAYEITIAAAISEAVE